MERSKELAMFFSEAISTILFSFFVPLQVITKQTIN